MIDEETVRAPPKRIYEGSLFGPFLPGVGRGNQQAVAAKMKVLILLTVISTIQSFSFLKTTPSPPHQHSTSSRPSKNVLHSTPTAQSSKTPTLSSLIALSLLLSPLTAHADGDTKTFKLPPIDRSQPSSTRCVLKSSAIGQSNAARDSLFDLR